MNNKMVRLFGVLLAIVMMAGLISASGITAFATVPQSEDTDPASGNASSTDVDNKTDSTGADDIPSAILWIASNKVQRKKRLLISCVKSITVIAPS